MMSSGEMTVGWEIKKLGEVCQIKPPKEEARQKLSDTDIVSFVPMSDLGIQSKIISLNDNKLLSEVVGSYTYFADNDVLLAKITPCFENGKLGIARNLLNGIGFGSSEYIVFRSKGTIDPEYLFYFLSQDSFRNSGASVMTGAVGHKRVPKEFIENHPIPLPPLPEQKRIVAIADEAFEGIDRAIRNTEKNLSNARELFESYLNSIFTQKSDRWKWVTLSEITTDITDGDHQPPPKSQSGIPFITISNIDKQNRKVDFSNTFKVSPEYFEKLKSNRKPHKGDLLYTVTGSYGIPVVVDHDIDFCFQRHIGLIRPNNETNSKCLYYILLSRYLLNQADECATGTAQKTVSLSGLRRFSVPKIPIKEQEVIVVELDFIAEKICRLETIYRQKIAALKELKQSILQKAFTGELTADKGEK